MPDPPKASQNCLGQTDVLQSVIDNAEAAIYAKDREGRFIFSNKYHSRLLGSSVSDIVGKRDSDFTVSKPYSKDYALNDERVWESGEAVESEEVLSEQDGEHVYISSKFPLRDAAGRIYAVCGISRDITERKRSEENLRELNQKLEQRVRERTGRLAESEAEFRGLIENTLDIPYHVDSTGNCRYIGPQVRNYGFDPNDMVGRNFLTFVLPPDRSHMEHDMKRAFAGEKPLPLEFRVHAPDGKTYWFEARSSAQRDKAGSIIGFTGVIRDITARKHAEEREQALLDNLEAFRNAVNQAPAVFFRWRIVPGEWPVEMVSENVRRFGYEAEEFTSGRVSWPGITHPSDVARLEKEVAELLKSGVRQFHNRYRLITKSGGIRHIEDWNSVIVNEQGQPTHIHAIVLDITQQHREEEKRYESEARYQALFNAESDAIMVFDAESRRFVDINEAAVLLYGYSRSEFLALKQNDITAEPEATEASVKQTIHGNARRIDLRWHRKKDGTVFPVEISPSLFTLGGRKVLCGIVRDISDRLASQEALRESEAKFRNLAEESPNMIFINCQGRIVYANRACEAATGYSKAELESPDFDFRVLIAREDLPKVEERYARELNGVYLPPCELKIVTKTGDVVEAILATRPIDYEGDRAVLGIGTDITGYKEAERAQEKQQERLQHLAASLASAQDEEQRRIAQGLHDDVAQLLTACSLHLEVASQIKDPEKLEATHRKLGAMLREANEKVRSMSFELSSSTLYRLGLEEALKELCENMSERYGIRFRLHAGAISRRINESTGTVLFKAARELLFNVVKHAGTTEAAVRVSRNDGSLQMQVEDQGSGFPADIREEGLHAGKGLGLLRIRERLRDIGGGMQIDCQRTGGACVTVWVPAGNQEKGETGTSWVERR